MGTSLEIQRSWAIYKDMNMDEDEYYQDVLDFEEEYIDVNQFVDDYEEDEGIYESLEKHS
jgi:hypothetical protein